MSDDVKRFTAIEERARIDRRLRVRGRVRVRLAPTQAETILRETLAHENIEIERAAIGRVVEQAPAIRTEGDVTIIPVLAEEVVVLKRLVLKEELRIHRRVRGEPYEERIVLRRNHPVIERLGPEGAPLNRTVTAFYKTRPDAERAADQLVSVGVPTDNINIVANDNERQERNGEGGGIFGAIARMFLPHEDTQTYGEGLRRGHAMLTARLDDLQTDAAIDILENSDALDLDTHERDWRDAGAAAVDRNYPPNAAVMAAGAPDATSALSAGVQSGASVLGESAERAIPIGEERLRVGKREVGRGGVRVRSYVVETPVEERVSLKTERVDIERRASDARAADADALFKEETVDFLETEEVPVVVKEAVVTEEVVVRKDVSERTETIRDTVRHTEVDVDETLDADGQPGGRRDV
jgi:uncharacterized protein (TIGR02271 family)